MDEVRLVDVEIGLTDGRSYKGELPANSPILESLFAGLVSSHNNDPNAPVTLIQFPIDDGDAACSFMSNALISVVTKPPVLINAVHQPRSAQALPGAGPKQAEPPAYVQIEDFLTPDENERVLKYALDKEQAFTGSTVLTADGEPKEDDHRKSRVLFEIMSSPWFKVFEQRLRLHFTHLGPSLGLDLDNLNLNELQLTASNDGDFFKAHADSSEANEKVASRQLTFVYYFHMEPKPYSGGDLVIYEDPYGSHTGGRAEALPPRNNCLVAFPSAALHEVDMVHCPSGAFQDSRFTINGWYGPKA